MGGNVVNLNRFRKKKERELADRERAARLLEGKRLEPGDPAGDE